MPYASSGTLLVPLTLNPKPLNPKIINPIRECSPQNLTPACKHPQTHASQSDAGFHVQCSIKPMSYRIQVIWMSGLRLVRPFPRFDLCNVPHAGWVSMLGGHSQCTRRCPQLIVQHQVHLQAHVDLDHLSSKQAPSSAHHIHP